MPALCKKKCQQYSVEYLSYGVIPSPESVTKPMSLNCMNVLSNDSMKSSKLKIHLETKQREKKNEPVEYFRQLDDLKEGGQCFKCLIAKANKVKDGLLASYDISKIIAKAGKPHNIGETVIYHLCLYLFHQL